MVAFNLCSDNTSGSIQCSISFSKMTLVWVWISDHLSPQKKFLSIVGEIILLGLMGIPNEQVVCVVVDITFFCLILYMLIVELKLETYVSWDNLMVKWHIFLYDHFSCLMLSSLPAHCCYTNCKVVIFDIFNYDYANKSIVLIKSLPHIIEWYL